MTPHYVARTIAELNKPNTWTQIQVGVFEICDGVESKIGDYFRNYDLLDTFCHFQKDGKDYALYSPHYTCTRIMGLPSCRDLGGEEPAGNGFCPVEYYVPCYIEKEYEDTDGKWHRYLVVDPQPKDFEPSTISFYPLDPATGKRIKIEKPVNLVTPLTYMPFGFVSGCVWGDDSSWKVQLLDISQVAKGIISREERFGYLPLPDKLSLKDSIDLINFELGNDEWTITIATQRSFEFKTGIEV